MWCLVWWLIVFYFFYRFSLQPFKSSSPMYYILVWRLHLTFSVGYSFYKKKINRISISVHNSMSKLFLENWWFLVVISLRNSTWSLFCTVHYYITVSDDYIVIIRIDASLVVILFFAKNIVLFINFCCWIIYCN